MSDQKHIPPSMDKIKDDLRLIIRSDPRNWEDIVKRGFDCFFGPHPCLIEARQGVYNTALKKGYTDLARWMGRSGMREFYDLLREVRGAI